MSRNGLSSGRMKGIQTLVLIAPVVFLSACGGSSTLHLQNPAPPAGSPVSITFQPAPAASVVLNSTAALTAVVNNDPGSSGVDWALLCGAGTDCGKLVPLHTVSGSPTTYTPPATISGNSQTFTIEAFATADHSKNLVAPIKVTGFAGNLKGNYVFQTRGLDANGAYELAGVITLDGNGNITGGEQTHSDSVLAASDRITGGSYALGPDGRGTLTIETSDKNIAQQGIENLSLVFLSSSQALLATLDNPSLPASNETSSGTMDLQTSIQPLQGGYAFAVGGTDLALQPMAMGGILNVDNPETISGQGSVADQDDAGTLSSNAAIAGNVTTPDAFGAVTFVLTAAFASSPLQFTGYMVDATHIKLIESDNSGQGTGIASTAGLAIGQGSATGTFGPGSGFTGNYVFGIVGEDSSFLPTSLASVGQFTASSAGSLTGGYNDEFLGGLSIEIADGFSGNYALDSAGIGRVDSTTNYTSGGAGPELIFYLTGKGGPALVLDADASLGAVGTGLAYPQTAAPYVFNGLYGLSFTQGSAGSESDATAAITVDGTARTLSGTVDTDFLRSPQPNTPISGSFAVISANGRSAGSLSNTFFPSPGSTPNTLAVDFYLIDSAHGFFIETDSLVSGQSLLGYFAVRTPVCATCP